MQYFIQNRKTGEWVKCLRPTYERAKAEGLAVKTKNGRDRRARDSSVLGGKPARDRTP